MSLRIGYVNVRGLSRASWEACLTLLNHCFDYLFIAETWFVNHQLYMRDRRFIASTSAPARNLQGRPRGGVYLLGSHQARSNTDKVSITEHSITFYKSKLSITGVYFPPTTLDQDSLRNALDSLRCSTVILGDMNVRFRDPVYQGGEPGPSDRLKIFTQFFSRTQFQHIKPDFRSQKLTTDHCFVQRHQPAVLRLLNNAGLKMHTDHSYTLCLILGQVIPTSVSEPTHSILRFRIGRLSQSRMRDQITNLINQQRQIFDKEEDVEAMHKKLVVFCQMIQEKVIGKRDLDQEGKLRLRKPLLSQQNLLGSIRLYKYASQASDENDVIFPTKEAQEQGVDAETENLNIYTQRWAGEQFHLRLEAGTQDTIDLWTREQVVAEIEQQKADKSCGADGIHIQFLKSVKDTKLITWLLELYNQCLQQGKTPQEWNRSEVYLLTKDTSKERNANNLRPISIISVFRKIFERLLLLHFQDQRWAQLHPAQAGFRPSYSTYSNAATVHALLTSRARSTVLFLDFKSAFDVLDHRRLDNKLRARGCPASLQAIIQSLMFLQLQSRILINGRVTDWFPRSCGVLQGSPLSPWLFNLFVDDLLHLINANVVGIPLCLFYADDGVIITSSKTDIQQLLMLVEEWTVQNRIFLNPTKCAIVTSQTHLSQLRVYNQEIPQKDCYSYLGFPVCAGGINFKQYLQQRIASAVSRAQWLGTQSNSWGPAHRLRIYKQFLAPMFEYGAPLVWAWALENPEAFQQATVGFGDLMAWVSNTANSRTRVTTNLCGLSSLEQRFQRLAIGYQLILEQMKPESPLKQLLKNPVVYSGHSSFLCILGNNSKYVCFKKTTNFRPTIRAALSRFLRAELYSAIQHEAQQTDLTALIPMRSRNTPGLYLADITLAAPVLAQSILFQYRRGVFMWNSHCQCGSSFRRGHETCQALDASICLSRHQRNQKRIVGAILPSEFKSKFTEIDYLLNTGQLQYAFAILTKVQTQLKQVYKDIQNLPKELS